MEWDGMGQDDGRQDPPMRKGSKVGELESGSQSGGLAEVSLLSTSNFCAPVHLVKPVPWTKAALAGT